jgi:hypothetical protein
MEATRRDGRSGGQIHTAWQSAEGLQYPPLSGTSNKYHCLSLRKIKQHRFFFSIRLKEHHKINKTNLSINKWKNVGRGDVMFFNLQDYD